MITRRGLIGGLAFSAMITEALAKKPQGVPPWLQAYYDKAWAEYLAQQRGANYGFALHYLDDAGQMRIRPIEPREIYK